MKRAYLLYFMTFLLVHIPLQAHSTHFISGFEDIPLMEGLLQTKNNDFSFENEEIHYIETFLISHKIKKFSQITLFYQEVLAQLGWVEYKRSPTSLSFYRENDILEITKIATSPLKISIVLKNKS